MKLGIISFAHGHAHSYAQKVNQYPHVELAAIWDDDWSRGERMASTYQCHFFKELSALLASDIDAVIICSENAKHKEHVVQAARAKKAILCEKPLAIEIDDAEEMIAVCQENDVLLQVAFPVRFAPLAQHVKQLLDDQVIGEVLAINSTNHGKMPGGWFVDKSLSGGGAAIDHIVHVTDLIRWMLKQEVTEVYAELATRYYDLDVEDCGMVMMELESGAIVSLDPSWSRPKAFPTWGDVTMKFVGTKGNLTVDMFRQNILFSSNENNQQIQLPWAEDMDQGLVENFITNVQQGRPPFISGEDGLRTLEVVKAAYRSAKTTKSVDLKAQV